MRAPKFGEFLSLTEFQEETTVRSFRPIICVCVRAPKRTHQDFRSELSESSADFSESLSLRDRTTTSKKEGFLKSVVLSSGLQDSRSFSEGFSEVVL